MDKSIKLVKMKEEKGVFATLSIFATQFNFQRQDACKLKINTKV